MISRGIPQGDPPRGIPKVSAQIRVSKETVLGRPQRVGLSTAKYTTEASSHRRARRSRGTARIILKLASSAHILGSHHSAQGMGGDGGGDYVRCSCGYKWNFRNREACFRCQAQLAPAVAKPKRPEGVWGTPSRKKAKGEAAASAASKELERAQEASPGVGGGSCVGGRARPAQTATGAARCSSSTTVYGSFTLPIPVTQRRFQYWRSSWV